METRDEDTDVEAKIIMAQKLIEDRKNLLRLKEKLSELAKGIKDEDKTIVGHIVRLVFDKHFAGDLLTIVTARKNKLDKDLSRIEEIILRW